MSKEYLSCSILNRVKRALFLRPIRVFVFHHVSDVRDPLVSGKDDWTQTAVFISNIEHLRKKYRFISLDSAFRKISKNRIRFKKYAVLTTDDGLQTVPYVFSWLEKKRIPLTCFINAKYMDGESYKAYDAIRIRRENPSADINAVIRRQYMTFEQVFSMNSPLISIASHGYEHLDATKMSLDDFRRDVSKCVDILSRHPRFVPYHAFAWGRHDLTKDRCLKEMSLVPVLVDGQKNYDDPAYIHRECIDGKKY